jgi:hypothetical protein
VEADPTPETPSRKLQAGEGIDRGSVRVSERLHVADDVAGVGPALEHADALPELRDIRGGDRSADRHGYRA